MTDGTGCATIIKGPSPPCCTTCALVLGFRQPVTALTHVAIGPVSEGRNSINKTHPLTRYTMLQQRHRGRWWTICSFLYHSPPVTCQSVLLMSNILGYHSYSLKPPSLALCNEDITQLVLVYCPWCRLSNQLASVCLPSGTSVSLWSHCHFSGGTTLE